jgi:hypothetical protein
LCINGQKRLALFQWICNHGWSKDITKSNSYEKLIRLYLYENAIGFIFCFDELSCFEQEVEFCDSVNTSSEQRFQNAYGVGLQCQQDLNQKFKVGLGIHYNFNDAVFDHIPYLDASPGLFAAEMLLLFMKPSLPISIISHEPMI